MTSPLNIFSRKLKPTTGKPGIEHMGFIPTAISSIPLDILWEGFLPRETMGKNAKKDRNDLLQGTLDLLILRTLQRGKQHGWGISQIIGFRSKEALNIKEGSLYPALHRLERQGWIESEWGLSDNNRKAKFYKLTRAGKQQLEEETAYWEQFVTAVSLVLSV